MSLSFWFSVFSFIVCIFVAQLLTKTKPFSFLGERKSRFETIDGLRGFLALSVVFHHFAMTYYWKLSGTWKRPPEDYYQNYGKVGVGIFFMITGFLFISKLLRSKGVVDWLKLYESRLFRIFPLYIFAVICISIIAFSAFDFQLNSNIESLLKDYLRWGLFVGEQINDFPDTRLVIAGVDWTLKYEWLFYFSLPIISLAIFRGGFPVVSAIIGLCILFFLYPVNLISFKTKYFILFAIGGISSWVINRQIIKIQNNWLSSGFAAFLIVFSLFYPNTFDFVHVITVSMLFILVVSGCDLFGLLRSKPAILLGEISYSIYLLHGLVLYVIFTFSSVVNVKDMDIMTYSQYMPLIGIVVTIFSSITYLLIEKPFLEIGHKYRITKTLRTLTGNATKACQQTSR